MKLKIYSGPMNEVQEVTCILTFPPKSTDPVTECETTPGNEHERSLYMDPHVRWYSPALKRMVGVADGWDYLEALHVTLPSDIEIEDGELRTCRRPPAPSL
jgi:hypothetical protein